VQEEERAEFIGAYARILSAAWSDEAYATKLSTNPEEALREYGLEVPTGASVTVARHIPADAAEPSIDTAVTKWEAGKATGIYVLSVPDEPQLASEELSEEDLASVAAGLTIKNCCCTPCCSCA
jgi:hypothetical protein